MNTDSNIRFVDEMHEAFYVQQSQKLRPDVYLRCLIYTLGICDVTRRNFNSIYDASDGTINLEAIFHGWQTGSTLKITRLAFQLFTNTTPTAFLDYGGDIDECRRYSVSDIFCCSFAPYFIEAISLRYPEYCY